MKYRFEKVVPIYTGGGIYCFYGKTDENYFISSDNYWVEFVDYIPFDDKKVIEEDMWQTDWLDAHTIKEFIDEKPMYEFLEQMYKWVIKEHKTNGYIMDGNYQIEEIEEWLLDEVRELRDGGR